MATIVGLLILVGFVLLLVVRNWPERGTPVGQITDAPIHGDDVVLLVSGWSDAELETILSDFGGMYDLPADAFRVIKGEAPAQIQIARPIDSKMLPFLVNYLHYPKELNFEGRQIAAVAVLKRSEALGGPPELAGRRATIYVPANDAEFDEVFVRVEPARYFRIPFTRLQWRPVDDGRETSGMRDLARRIP
jgi:hypothetical protein